MHGKPLTGLSSPLLPILLPNICRHLENATTQCNFKIVIQGNSNIAPAIHPLRSATLSKK